MNGLLLVNLGTPDAPETGPVRRYLAEFLSDPRVLDMPAIARFLLLYGVILPFRPKRSAAAYKKVWDPERGSPLLFHSRDLAEGVAARLGQSWTVALGMRYGRPSLQDALQQLIDAGCTRLFVLPLYPQYASSTTGSTTQALYELTARLAWVPPITVMPPFFEHPRFIEATVEAAADTLGRVRPAHVFFSFHGIPERQVQATDLSPDRSHCLASDACCERLTAANRGCYRAQCFATARALAERMGLSRSEWSIGFQSRLGRIPWIRPYTDDVLHELSERGVGPVVVLCPSFVADCLETLEEIGMEAVSEYGEPGLHLAPCLNSHPVWVDAVAGLAREAAGSASD